MTGPLSVSTTALDIRGLSIRSSTGDVLVQDVSLFVSQTGSTTLVGETGSGKSLVSQAVLGLLPRGMWAEGEITVNGRAIAASDVRALRQLWARETMILPQEPAEALDPTMRLLPQLAEAGGMPRARRALAAVDLPEEAGRAWPHMLSGGMAQRGLAAMALTSDAGLIVADEPTKGLDPRRLALAIKLLAELRQSGRSLLTITHDLSVARRLGGTLAVMREGRIVESGPAERLLTEPEEAYTRAWLAADPATWPPRRRNGSTECLLQAEGVAFSYDGCPPLTRPLDLALGGGEIVGLCGPSGCGKTTFGNVLLGLHRPRAGRVSWQGRLTPYTDRAGLRRLRRHYQKLHQDPVRAFVPNRPLDRQFEDLRPVLPDADLRGTLAELLDRLSLRKVLLDRLPAEISGGEAQRFAIARLLLLDPLVIIADEPTSRLDPIVQRDVVELLASLADERGMGLILISHDAALLRAVAPQIIDLSASDDDAQARMP